MSRPQGVQATHQLMLNSGKFTIQQCGGCSGFVYYPRESCPHCGSEALDWIEPGGAGSVYAVTTVRRKPADGGDLNISIVELDEGVRLMSRVLNLDPDSVHIGMRVQARVEVIGGQGLVMFDAVRNES